MCQRRRWRTLAASLAGLSLAGASLLVTPLAQAAATVPTNGLVAAYDFSETAGTILGDSVAAGNGTVVGGEAWNNGTMTFTGSNYVKLPNGLLAGRTAASVTVEARPGSTSLSGNNFLWSLGGSATSDAGTGQFFVQTNGHRAAISTTNWTGENRATAPSAFVANTWQSITTTITPNDGAATSTLRLYVDGTQVAENLASTASVADLTTHTNNLIGASAYAADAKFTGAISSFRVYDRALTAAEVADVASVDAATSAQESVAGISLGDTTALRANLSLPTAGGVTWATSDPSVIEANGTIHRTDVARQATLTAAATVRGSTASRTFTVTVSPASSADELAQADLDALSILNANDIRGNVTLAQTGSINDAAITWSASPAGVITTQTTGQKAPGVVTRGATDTTVTLTATVAGTNASRALVVTVKATPQNLDTDYTAGYLWTHFAVESSYEKIFFGYSADGLHWEKLNQNKSILASLSSDLGVRDPQLVRSPDGDKYWILGTDLHAEGGGAGGSGWDQLNASQDILVWESTDLVNWSEPRVVFAGFDYAGCVWAPEAYYDETTGDYYVYWSARDQRDNGTDNWALRVYMTRTRDFQTFTTPVVWLDENDPANGADGPNIIDTTIAKEGNTYYRFSTSDWRTVVDTATSLAGPWTRVIARGQESAHGLPSRIEGLTVYQLPDGRWAVMGDNGGYVAATADTLASLEFTSLSAGSGANQYSFEQRFRHGSVIRLSQAEEDRLLAAYGDPETPQQDPIATYTFDDGTLADSTGDADLTASGTAAVKNDVTKGKALYLDGSTSGFASFPQGFFDGRSTVSISMDVKSELSSGNFFTFAIGQDTTKYYYLRTRGSEVRSAITNNSWQAESAAVGSVSSGDWHTITAVFDGTTMKLYSDGVLIGSNSELSTSLAGLGTALQAYLGKSLFSADGYFKGWFDNIKIYNRALTAAEISEATPLALVGATVGSVPADPDTTTGTDDHTAVVSNLDQTAKTISPWVRSGTDLTKVPVNFTVAPATATITVDGQPFVNGSVLDLSQDRTVIFTKGATTATWTLKKPQISGNPVLPGQYADPDIDVFDGKFWIFPTTDGFSGWGGYEFHAWSSTDLVTWVDEGVILDVKNKTPGTNAKGVQIASVPWSNGNGWAPTIEEKDGKYYFYFSAHDPSSNAKAIGVAVADNPAGPYTAQDTPLITKATATAAGVNLGQAIDPSVFTDDDGTSYLTFGNGNGPVVVELGADMTSLVPGTMKNVSGLTDFRESVSVIKINGLYHWTWSVDDTGSPNYHVNYGTSTSLYGPVTFKYTLLQKDEAQGILGTAHQSILRNGDDYYIAYHSFYTPLGTYSSGLGYHRETRIDKISFTADGLMAPVTPTMTGVAATTVHTTPGSATVQSIAVTMAPTKTDYVAGESFSPAGLKVEATLSDSSTRVLADDEYTLTGTDLSTAATKTITITLVADPTVTTTFTVTVRDRVVPEPEKITGTTPAIVGTAQVGRTLSANPGVWAPSGVRVSYQWYADGRLIKGATGKTYQVIAGDRGKRVTVKVLGTKAGLASVTLTSPQTAKVTAGRLSTTRPVIKGKAKVGRTLKVVVRQAKPAPVKVSYQWYAKGKKIKGATKKSYKIKSAYRGKRITVKVTTKKSGYLTVTKASKATKKVAR